MENLLRTVNMGKLAGEDIHMSTLAASKIPERSECEYLLQPLGPQEAGDLIAHVKQR